jgi:HK97 family phage prohead protease
MTTEVRANNIGELRFVIDGGKPRIDGRAILFNSWSVDLGGFRERMLPGSAQLDQDLVALFDHDTSMVLGRTSAGTMTATQDERGVAFTTFPPATTWANDLRISMDRGDIRGCSYRMMVDEDRWYVQDGLVCRDILKARVSELTITSMPAYPETTAEARSQAEALAKASKTEDRAGRVLSDGNEQILKSAVGQIETAIDAIGNVIKSVDPSFDENQVEAPEPEDDLTDPALIPDAGRTPGSDLITDGSSDETDRSSVGATEPATTRTQTFIAGFGFIPNPTNKGK